MTSSLGISALSSKLTPLAQELSQSEPLPKLRENGLSDRFSKLPPHLLVKTLGFFDHRELGLFSRLKTNK
jgi:hypothetical protein